MINKLILYGLEERAKELKEAGKRDSEIARILTKESEKEITQMTICRYWRSERETKVKDLKEIVSVSKDEDLPVKPPYFDAASQLNHINQETLKILTKAKNAGELKIAMKAIERVEKQIDLVAKIISQISEQQTTQVIINVVQVEEQRQ